MIEAGRERAKIHADADEHRAKLQGAKSGSVEYTKFRENLKGVDGKLRAASVKFDDALREALKVAFALSRQAPSSPSLARWLD